MSLVYSLFLLVPVLTVTSSISYTPVIDTSNGPVRGLVSTLNTGKTIRRYLGIPYGKAERFTNPTDPKPWDNVEDVITYGKKCPQPVTSWAKLADMSEDCLNLNVYVPGTNISSPRSVMVWIHGGTFITGSNRYDGSYLATLGDVIVVTINYRLNVLGFLSGINVEGNYGMRDQIHALKFGGNPSNVTIFGVSAGGASVSHLVLSPLASGLFVNAIPQAGDATAVWAYKTMEEGHKTAKIVSQIMRCKDATILVTCLKTRSYKEIVQNIGRIRAAGGGFAPVVGGTFQPDSPLDAIMRGNVKVNMLIGFNNDEGTVVTNAVKGWGSGFNVTNGFERSTFESVLRTGQLNWMVRGQNNVINEAILYRYTDWNDVTNRYGNRRMLLDMFGDVLFLAPAFHFARAIVKQSVKTYMYQLQYRFDSEKVPAWVGAYHAADKAVVFGQPFSGSNASLHTKDANFSRRVIKMWSNFAKTGDPNKPADIGIVWPQYNLQEQHIMALKPAMTVQSKLRNEYMAFWNTFVAAAVKSMKNPTSHSAANTLTSVGKTSGVKLFLVLWIFSFILDSI